MNKQTSGDVSSVAAHILAMKPAQGTAPSPNQYNSLLANAKTVAGSALSQDETKGNEPRNFLDRLLTERDELKSKRDALAKFLGTGETPASLTNHHHELLTSQLQAMSLYLTILNLRLADLGAETPTVASDQPPTGECTHEVIFSAEMDFLNNRPRPGKCTRCGADGIPTYCYAQSAARAPGFLTRLPDTQTVSERERAIPYEPILELNEPVEIGGHDEDRDGPVKFEG